MLRLKSRGTIYWRTSASRHVRLVRGKPNGAKFGNYREQKWDIEEGETYEGDTNEARALCGQSDLAKDHEG